MTKKKSKTDYRAHREGTGCTFLVNCLVDLKNVDQKNQIDKKIAKIRTVDHPYQG
jgi:hypothetical protein